MINFFSSILKMFVPFQTLIFRVCLRERLGRKRPSFEFSVPAIFIMSRQASLFSFFSFRVKEYDVLLWPP